MYSSEDLKLESSSSSEDEKEDEKANKEETRIDIEIIKVNTTITLFYFILNFGLKDIKKLQKYEPPNWKLIISNTYIMKK